MQDELLERRVLDAALGGCPGEPRFAADGADCRMVPASVATDRSASSAVRHFMRDLQVFCDD